MDEFGGPMSALDTGDGWAATDKAAREYAREYLGLDLPHRRKPIEPGLAQLLVYQALHPQLWIWGGSPIHAVCPGCPWHPHGSPVWASPFYGMPPNLFRGMLQMPTPWG